eukprot:766203-Hanusia_phi.AAC.12
MDIQRNQTQTLQPAFEGVKAVSVLVVYENLDVHSKLSVFLLSVFVSGPCKNHGYDNSSNTVGHDGSAF